MHQSSYIKMESFIRDFSNTKTISKKKVLDFGSYDYNGSYRSLFDDEKWEYIGVDLQEGPNVDLKVKNPHDWDEINSNEFDLVISGQAMEHCEFFWIVFQEIYRVLKPNGYTCIIAPSSGPEHRYPVDCWRFYPDGMRAICKFVGLEVVSVQTEWDPPNYTDGSEEWRDTTLIAKKTVKKTPK